MRMDICACALQLVGRLCDLRPLVLSRRGGDFAHLLLTAYDKDSRQFLRKCLIPVREDLKFV